jgi:hypothetical protein
MDITFRTLGPWGAGKGANLLPSEVDSNFYSIAQAVTALENDPTLPNGIANITVSGTQMTFTLTNGDVVGPFTLPVLTFRWRDAWEPSTSYAVLDVFTVPDTGIFCVVIAHTSGTTFDPALTIGGQPALKQLFGSTDSRLAGLSDVDITTLADGDVLRWVVSANAWENRALGSMATQDDDAVNIIGGFITGMPTPVDPLDVANKAYVDSLPTGSTAPDATLLANTSGAVGPTIPTTLSNYLDYVFQTTVRGTLIFRSGTGWTSLAPGTTPDLFLQTLGAGADPQWAPGVTGVSAIYAGTGISTGTTPILTTGTVSLAALPDGQFLANISGVSAAPVPNTITQFLDHVLTNARGTLLTRTSTGWVGIAPGSSGQYLKTQGTGSDVIWDNPAGAGTVTSITAGTGISTGGSPITATGTVALAAVADSTVLGNASGASAAPVPTTLGVLFDHVFSATQGSILYRSGTGWVALGPGTVGQVLSTGGTGANVSWINPPVGSSMPNLRILANISGSPAVATANTVSSVFDAVFSSSRGVIMYRTSSGWAALAPGTSGQVLTTGGPSSDPHWVAGSAAALAGLSDVTITTPADQDQLTYISSAAKWQNKTLSSVIDAALSSTRGAVLFRGAAAWSALPPGTSGQILTTAGAGADPNWAAPAAAPAARYVVSCFVPGVMTTSQRLLYHRFSKAATFPANFGTTTQGHTSEAGGSANATASTVINVDKAGTATPNTFSTVGTITIAAGSITPTFATTGGTTVSFAVGDVLRIVGPSTADATFADFYATLAGSE